MEGWVDLDYPAMQRRKSNLRPLDHKSDTLTTTLPSISLVVAVFVVAVVGLI